MGAKRASRLTPLLLLVLIIDEVINSVIWCVVRESACRCRALMAKLLRSREQV